MIAICVLHRAAGARELRRLTPTDVDAGHLQMAGWRIVLTESVQARLAAYLDYRRTRWPYCKQSPLRQPPHLMSTRPGRQPLTRDTGFSTEPSPRVAACAASAFSLRSLPTPPRATPTALTPNGSPPARHCAPDRPTRAVNSLSRRSPGPAEPSWSGGRRPGATENNLQLGRRPLPVGQARVSRGTLRHPDRHRWAQPR